ncbi:MAG: isoprenylcysteine carboxylmethyltransferase family protein [Saprospiraceae bacterium]|nr:isoprenylcysteine carboxylmethyltransferase family protein [Saprospiraceae bacterium]
MNYLQIAALLYVLIYYGILLGFRSYLLYKNTGINPIKNKSKHGLAGFIENVFGVCFVLISVIAFNFAFLEKNYVFYLIPIDYLELTWLNNLGIVLSFSGLAIAFIAQLQMGNSWRLGLNESEKTPLIRKGLYHYSRNPVYVGILLSNFGFFLMMPNALSFCFLAVSYLAIEVKIRLEEQYLIAQHGAEFSNYLKQVRRWI